MRVCRHRRLWPGKPFIPSTPSLASRRLKRYLVLCVGLPYKNHYNPGTKESTLTSIARSPSDSLSKTLGDRRKVTIFPSVAVHLDYVGDSREVRCSILHIRDGKFGRSEAVG